MEELPKFSRVAAPFDIPASNRWRFHFFHNIASACYTFDNSSPSVCEVESPWGFDLHFLDGSWCWGSFHILTFPLCIFGEMSIKITCPVFSWIYLSFSCWAASILYVLWTWILNRYMIFSSFLGYTFNLLLFFATQKLLILITSKLSVFSFALCTFAVISKKPLPNLRPQRFIKMFSPKSFIIFSFKFRPLVHFEIICVYGLC